MHSICASMNTVHFIYRVFLNSREKSRKRIEAAQIAVRLSKVNKGRVREYVMHSLGVLWPVVIPSLRAVTPTLTFP